MDNETIKQTQGQYQEFLGELENVAAKMKELGDCLVGIVDAFESGNTISVQEFGDMIRLAQEYYSVDMKLKSALPDTDAEAGFSVAGKTAMLKEKLELLDRELVKNSVNTYFELRIGDAERVSELEESKGKLRAILENPEGIDMAAIRPYMSILTIVKDPDAELSDELMDEMDDTFSKPFMRAVLRGKLNCSHALDGEEDFQATAPAPGVPIAGHAQTLD